MKYAEFDPAAETTSVTGKIVGIHQISSTLQLIHCTYDDSLRPCQECKLIQHIGTTIGLNNSWWETGHSYSTSRCQNPELCLSVLYKQNHRHNLLIENKTSDYQQTGDA